MDDYEELSTNTLTCTDIWCVKTRWARIRHGKVIFRFQSRQAWAFWATIPPFTAPLNGKWGSTPPLVHPPAAGLKGQEMPLIYWPNWADFMFFDWFPDSLRLRYPQVRSPLGEEHASWTYKLMHFISNVLYLISTHCYNLDYVNMSIYVYTYDLSNEPIRPGHGFGATHLQDIGERVLLPFLRETLHHRSSQSQHGANGISNFQHVVFSFHVCFDQGSIDSTSNCCQCYLPPQKKQTFEPQLGTGSNSQIVATQRTTSFLKMPMQTVAMTVIQHPRKK